MGIGSAGKAAKSAQEAQIQMQQKAAEEARAARAAAAGKMQTAVDANPLPTYLEGPEALKYKQTLEDRMAGRGLIDVNALTSPIAAQIRAGLKNTTANIGAAASARGLGRSTVATSQIGEASQAAERDIAERMANLELTRQQQVQDAVSGFGDVTKTEYDSQSNKTQFKRAGEFEVANVLRADAEAFKNDQFSIANMIAQRGITEAASRVQNQKMWEKYGQAALSMIVAGAGAAGGGAGGGLAGQTQAFGGGVKPYTPPNSEVLSSINKALVLKG